jgi:hypothetical protein
MLNSILIIIGWFLSCITAIYFIFRYTDAYSNEASKYKYNKMKKLINSIKNALAHAGVKF